MTNSHAGHSIKIKIRSKTSIVKAVSYADGSLVDHFTLATSVRLQYSSRAQTKTFLWSQP